jgi:hypothetical protein
MGVERRVAVRTEDAQVLEAVVVPHAVDVIEHERHPGALPHLALAADLATRLLEALREQASFESHSGIGRVLDEHLGERRGLAQGWSKVPPRIEVIRGDAPQSDVLLQGRVVPAGRPQPEPDKCIRIREGCRDGRSRLLFAIPHPSRHDRTLFDHRTES